MLIIIQIKANLYLEHLWDFRVCVLTNYLNAILIIIFLYVLDGYKSIKPTQYRIKRQIYKTNKLPNDNKLKEGNKCLP